MTKGIKGHACNILLLMPNQEYFLFVIILLLNPVKGYRSSIESRKTMNFI